VRVPKESVPDSKLVRRVQRGDKRAFDLLVLKYQHRVRVIVGRYIKDHGEVDDVVQESFIKAYRALGGFRGDSQFYTWLYRIAVNTAKNFLVARSRRPPSSDVDLEDAEYFSGNSGLVDLDTPEHLAQSEELRAVIEAAIAGLPEELRVAITLREFDGLSYEDIAHVMGCPVGTVRSRIFRAREAIDLRVSALMDEGR
jgi:RNA polymerase sigma-70 factor (ECF subfamily)